MTEPRTKAAIADPAWDQAMDWLLRCHQAPHDHRLSQGRDLWLTQAPDHARAYARAERVWRLAGELGPALAPVTAQPVPRPAKPRRRRLAAVTALAMAAALAAVVVAGPHARWWHDAHTGKAETRRLALADGSVVELAAESAVDITLDGQRRQVSLAAGRAFFQVAPDPAHPFVVTAGSATITVTGTAFDLRRTGNGAAVEVESGSVLVAVDQDGRHQQARLERGGRAQSAADGSLRVDKVAPSQVGLWRSGRLVVDGIPLEQMVEELRPHYPGLIVLRDPELARRQVTGVFDLTSPALALRTALQLHGGTVREVTPFVLVVSRP